MASHNSNLPLVPREYPGPEKSTIKTKAQ